MKKNRVLITLIIISFLLIIFTYNNDFLYKNTIMKITTIELLNEDISSNSLGLEEKHYTKKITGVITNGEKKGKIINIEYEETFSSIVTDKYKVNDKVFIKSGNIDELKRDVYVISLICIFIIAIYLVGNYRGLLAVVSVVLNSFIFYMGLNLYFKGINLTLLCLLESILFTIISLYIASGKGKKTMSAIISVFISLLIIFIMTLIISLTTNYSGISFNEMNYLTVPVTDVLLAELVIGGLGAIMDVSITMSSSISELIEKDKNISKKSLINSGREIGKDIMSTMINVLFFTYLCSGLPLFVLSIRNGFSIYNFVSTSFSIELSRFLIGSIGIIITIPISLFVSMKIFKRGDINE